MISRARFNIAVYLAVLVMLCDQMSKWWILHQVDLPEGGLRVVPYFNLVMVQNRGATFGILSRYDPRVTFYILTGVGVVILLFLGQWLWRTSSTTVAASLGLIMGGAIGNLVDRVRFGAVVDFLDFYIVYQGHEYHWPAFNLADSAIVTGVGILLLDSLIRRR